MLKSVFIEVLIKIMTVGRGLADWSSDPDSCIQEDIQPLKVGL